MKDYNFTYNKASTNMHLDSASTFKKKMSLTFNKNIKSNFDIDMPKSNKNTFSLHIKKGIDSSNTDADTKKEIDKEMNLISEKCIKNINDNNLIKKEFSKKSSIISMLIPKIIKYSKYQNIKSNIGRLK